MGFGGTGELDILENMPVLWMAILESVFKYVPKLLIKTRCSTRLISLPVLVIMQSSYEICVPESQEEGSPTVSRAILQEHLIPKFLHKCNHVK